MSRKHTYCLTIDLRRRFKYAKKTGTVKSILKFYIKLLNTARYCLCDNKFCKPYKFSKLDLQNLKKELIKLIDIPEETLLGKHQWRGQKQKQ